MKTIRNTVIAALAFAGAFSFGTVASAAPEYPADQTLTVQLVDAESVHPIAGAKVSIYNYVTGETILVKSDKKGWVKVDSLYGMNCVHVRTQALWWPGDDRPLRSLRACEPFRQSTGRK